MIASVSGALARAATRSARPALSQGVRARNMATSAAPASGFSLYNTLFSSNARYVLFVVAGATAGELVYGFVGDSIWEMNNRGKLYHHIDWSKWESLYVPDEDEEDEEDDE
mmetsp:Transcript_4907/g.10159  ORF Transcript_4907/g.10159 Transcript_4907/m.10159 type:complete len:111 (+) Transcript_4907:81-413(+)